MVRTLTEYMPFCEIESTRRFALRQTHCPRVAPEQALPRARYALPRAGYALHCSTLQEPGTQNRNSVSSEQREQQTIARKH
jgi:hypothetical protein